jgi:hypothetical protein
MGYGNLRKVHSKLFDEFIASLEEQLGDRRRLTWDNLARELPVLPQTQALIEGERVLYTGDPATGAGAQLALEWAGSHDAELALRIK